jgi:transcription elongation factor Elf1
MTLPTDDELNPCPFCGGGASLINGSVAGGQGYAVKCSICYAAIGFDSDGNYFPFHYYILASDAIAAWNTRAERTVNVAEAARGPDRNATISLALKADSGYRADETARVSAEQWGRILAIIYEPSALAGYPK